MTTSAGIWLEWALDQNCSPFISMARSWSRTIIRSQPSLLSVLHPLRQTWLWARRESGAYLLSSQNIFKARNSSNSLTYECRNLSSQALTLSFSFFCAFVSHPHSRHTCLDPWEQNLDCLLLIFTLVGDEASRGIDKGFKKGSKSWRGDYFLKGKIEEGNTYIKIFFLGVVNV